MSQSLFTVVKRILKTKRKGNRKEQQKRRRQAHRKVEPLPYECQLIDGNWSSYAVARCRIKKGYLTLGLIQTHNCTKCVHFQEGVENEKEILQPS